MMRTAVTNERAREYFKEKKLSYSDISQEDIDFLIAKIKDNLKELAKTQNGKYMDLSLNPEVNIEFSDDGSLDHCFLWIDGSYFEKREAIAFNRDGFIGFAGWADSKNVMPLLMAFKDFCDHLVEEKT